MIKLDITIPAFNYLIVGGCEFQWDCYGPNARYLDFAKGEKLNGHAIFDAKTQQVYELQMWTEDKFYMWIDKKFIAKYNEECVKRGIHPEKVLDEPDTPSYNMIPTPKKMLNIINGHFSGALE